MKLPALLALDASQKDAVLLTLDVSPDLEAFGGHFPDNPILPGVVQIDWAIRFAILHLGLTKPSTRDFQVKYRNIIRPQVPLSLKLQMDRAKNHLSFTYVSGEMLMSSGMLKLGVPT